MSLQKKIKLRRERRTFRVRGGLTRNGNSLRVSVCRSLKQIHAQVIDDSAHTTLASFSSLTLKNKTGDKKAIAKQVGIELGKLASSKGAEKVFFDRGRYLYHGRVKALADGLREGGLKF